MGAAIVSVAVAAALVLVVVVLWGDGEPLSSSGGGGGPSEQLAGRGDQADDAAADVGVEPTTTAAPEPPRIDRFSAEVVATHPDLVGLGNPAAISPDGRYIFTQREQGEVCAIALDEGASDVCVPWEGSLAPMPEWSPDGRRVAFTENLLVFLQESDLWVLDVETGELRNLTDDGQPPSERTASAPGDHLPSWGAESDELYALRFVQVQGEPVLQIISVRLDGGGGVVIHQFTEAIPVVMSPLRPLGAGQFLVAAERDNAPSSGGIWKLDVATGDLQLIAGEDSERGFGRISEISPDGRLAIVFYAGYAGLGNRSVQSSADVLDLATGERRPLIEDGESMRVGPYAAGFSPDGRFVVVAWVDESTLTEAGNREQPTPKVSIASVEALLEAEPEWFDVLRWADSSDEVLNSLRAVGDQLLGLGWTPDDRLHFADLRDIVTIRLTGD